MTHKQKLAPALEQELGQEFRARVSRQQQRRRRTGRDHRRDRGRDHDRAHIDRQAQRLQSRQVQVEARRGDGQCRDAANGAAGSSASRRRRILSACTPTRTNYWSRRALLRERADQGSEARHAAPDRRRLGDASICRPRDIQRFRLALATKPYDVFFLCHVPTQNLDNSWNSTQPGGCEQAKTRWVKATSRKDEGVEGYKIDFARDADAFPEPKWPTQSLGELIARDLRRPHDRHARTTRPAAPDRCEAVDCREQELRHDRRRRLRIRDRRRRTAERALHGRVRAG